MKSPNIFRKISSRKLDLFQRIEIGKTAFLIDYGIVSMKTLELSELNFQCSNVKARDCFIHFFFLTVGKI